MLRNDFKKFLSKTESLTHTQRKRLLLEINENTHSKSVDLIESQFEDIKSCPHCESMLFSRWGKSNKLQRYRCGECKATFNALTGTPLARLRHKERWLTYSACLNDGLTVRQAAAHCDIDLKTSFRWRHRFLASPMRDKRQQMMGIVEADETFFTESRKGDGHLDRPARKRGKSNKKELGERVPVLMVRDRCGTVADFVFEKIEKETMHNCLRPLMSEEVVLCSDGNSIYKTFAEQENIPHKRIIALDNVYVVDEIFHIQNLNAYMSRLKNWMVKFNGVATKYLANYLGWRRLLEKQKGNLSSGFCFQHALARTNQQLMPT